MELCEVCKDFLAITEYLGVATCGRMICEYEVQMAADYTSESGVRG